MQIYRACDFGSTNPTAFLWIAVDEDDNWFIVDEYYESGQTIDYIAGVVNSKSQGMAIQATYGDPSRAQRISEFSQRGIYITPANKETGQNQEGWVRYGIEKVAEKLKRVPGRISSVPLLRGGNFDSTKGEPSLYIFSTCNNILKEIETYRWKEKSVTQAQDLNSPEQPEKANDHAMDALRYFAVSYKRQDGDWDNVNEGLNAKWKL